MSPNNLFSKKILIYIERKKNIIESDKVVELVGGGSVINGVTPSSFLFSKQNSSLIFILDIL